MKSVTMKKGVFKCLMTLCIFSVMEKQNERTNFGPFSSVTILDKNGFRITCLKTLTGRRVWLQTLLQKRKMSFCPAPPEPWWKTDAITTSNRWRDAVTTLTLLQHPVVLSTGPAFRGRVSKVELSWNVPSKPWAATQLQASDRAPGVVTRFCYRKGSYV